MSGPRLGDESLAMSREVSRGTALTNASSNTDVGGLSREESFNMPNSAVGQGASRFFLGVNGLSLNQEVLAQLAAEGRIGSNDSGVGFQDGSVQAGPPSKQQDQLQGGGQQMPQQRKSPGAASSSVGGGYSGVSTGLGPSEDHITPAAGLAGGSASEVNARYARRLGMGMEKALVVHLLPRESVPKPGNQGVSPADQLAATARVVIPALCNFLYFGGAKVAVLYLGKQKTKTGVKEGIRGGEALKRAILHFMCSEIWPPLLTDVPDDHAEDTKLHTAVNLLQLGTMQALVYLKRCNPPEADAQKEKKSPGSSTRGPKGSTLPKDYGYVKVLLRSTGKLHFDIVASHEEKQRWESRKFHMRMLDSLQSQKAIFSYEEYWNAFRMACSQSMCQPTWPSIAALLEEWEQEQARKADEIIANALESPNTASSTAAAFSLGPPEGGSHGLFRDGTVHNEDDRDGSFSSPKTGASTATTTLNLQNLSMNLNSKGSVITSVGMESVKTTQSSTYLDPSGNTEVFMDALHSGATPPSQLTPPPQFTVGAVATNDNNSTAIAEAVKSSKSPSYFLEEQHPSQIRNDEGMDTVFGADRTNKLPGIPIVRNTGRSFQFFEIVEAPESVTLDYKSYYADALGEIEEKGVKFMCGFLNAYGRGKLVVGVHEIRLAGSMNTPTNEQGEPSAIVVGANINEKDLDGLATRLAIQLEECVPPIPSQAMQLELVPVNMPSSMQDSPTLLLFDNLEDSQALKEMRSKSNAALRVLAKFGLALAQLSVEDIPSFVIEDNDLTLPVSCFCVVKGPDRCDGDGIDPAIVLVGETLGKDGSASKPTPPPESEERCERQRKTKKPLDWRKDLGAQLTSTKWKHAHQICVLEGGSVKLPVLHIIEVSVDRARVADKMNFTPYSTRGGKFFNGWPSIPMWNAATNTVSRMDRNYSLFAHLPAQGPLMAARSSVGDSGGILLSADKPVVDFSPDSPTFASSSYGGLGSRVHKSLMQSNMETSGRALWTAPKWYDDPDITLLVMEFTGNYTKKLRAFRLLSRSFKENFDDMVGLGLLSLLEVGPTCIPASPLEGPSSPTEEQSDGDHVDPEDEGNPIDSDAAHVKHQTKVSGSGSGLGSKTRSTHHHPLRATGGSALVASFTQAGYQQIRMAQIALMRACLPTMPLLLTWVYTSTLGGLPSPFPYVAVPLAMQHIRLRPHWVPLYYTEGGLYGAGSRSSRKAHASHLHHGTGRDPMHQISVRPVNPYGVGSLTVSVIYDTRDGVIKVVTTNANGEAAEVEPIVGVGFDQITTEDIASWARAGGKKMLRFSFLTTDSSFVTAPWGLKNLLLWLNTVSNDSHVQRVGNCERSLAYCPDSVTEVCAAHFATATTRTPRTNESAPSGGGTGTFGSPSTFGGSSRYARFFDCSLHHTEQSWVQWEWTEEQAELLAGDC